MIGNTWIYFDNVHGPKLTQAYAHITNEMWSIWFKSLGEGMLSHSKVIRQASEGAHNNTYYLTMKSTHWNQTHHFFIDTYQSIKVWSYTNKETYLVLESLKRLITKIKNKIKLKRQQAVLPHYRYELEQHANLILHYLFCTYIFLLFKYYEWTKTPYMLGK